MRWVVLVRSPPHKDAIGFLPMVDGEPEVVGLAGLDWYVFAKRSCAIDIAKDAKLAMDIGWAHVHIKKLDS
jgi:hypothetical protein